MEIIIQCQGMSESPWMNEYLKSKLGRLERYLPTGAHVRVDLVTQECLNFSQLSVKTHKHDYSFRGDGQDIFEAFTHTLEEALRILRHEHQLLIERVHRKFAGNTDVIRP